MCVGLWVIPAGRNHQELDKPEELACDSPLSWSDLKVECKGLGDARLHLALGLVSESSHKDPPYALYLPAFSCIHAFIWHFWIKGAI